MDTAQTRLTGREYIEEIRRRREARRMGSEQTAVSPTDSAVTPEAAPSGITQEATAVGPTPSMAQPDPAPQVNLDADQLLANSIPGIEKPLAEETVYEWNAPSRPFKKRNRQYYTTIAAIVFLVSLILFFAGQFLPIAVVISVAFLAYVLSSVPPQPVKNKLTTYGLRVEDQLYYWQEMGFFWFDSKYGQDLVHIEIMRFPNRLTLMIGESTQAELRELLSQILLEQKPKPTFFDKAAAWIQEKIPLEVE